MTDREFFISRRGDEFKMFQEVLRALPADKISYKPHDRSPSAADIMWIIAKEHEGCVQLLDEGKMEWKDVPPPKAASEIIKTFEQSWRALDERLKRTDEAAWNRNGKFLYQGKVVDEQPVGTSLWFMLFDAIHHRGQLTSYLRPMGGKVPAVYGPSADTKEQAA
jgi:uncharacterized damage-inducible protein DinB